MLEQKLQELVVQTRAGQFSDVTGPIQRWLSGIGAREGLLTVFLQHTSASLTIQENADPDVLSDLSDALDRMAPRDRPYRHSVEGPDDMPAHIKAMLTQASLSIPVCDGRAALGQWQAIYVVEHRDQPHRRHIRLHFLGRLSTTGS